jgi:hypothetical protein
MGIFDAIKKWLFGEPKQKPKEREPIKTEIKSIPKYEAGPLKELRSAPKTTKNIYEEYGQEYIKQKAAESEQELKQMQEEAEKAAVKARQKIFKKIKKKYANIYIRYSLYAYGSLTESKRVRKIEGIIEGVVSGDANITKIKQKALQVFNQKNIECGYAAAFEEIQKNFGSSHISAGWKIEETNQRPQTQKTLDGERFVFEFKIKDLNARKTRFPSDAYI